MGKIRTTNRRAKRRAQQEAWRARKWFPRVWLTPALEAHRNRYGAAWHNARWRNLFWGRRSVSNTGPCRPKLGGKSARRFIIDDPHAPEDQA